VRGHCARRQARRSRRHVGKCGSLVILNRRLNSLSANRRPYPLH